MALQFVTDQIKDLNITTGKLAANAVTAAKSDLTDTWSFVSGTLRAAEPTASTDVATKNYVDNIAAGLHWHESVKVSTTGNITLSGTQTIDGIAAGVGDRVLVKAQSSASENGVYVVAGGAWSRAADLDAGAEFPGAAMFVREGSLYADTGWVCTNDAVTLDSTAVVFAQFTGGGALVGGDGIVITGNQIAADLATGGGLEFASGEIQIAAGAVTNAMLGGSIANSKLSNSAVTVTAGTGLAGGGSVALGSTVTLNVSGLTNSEISNSAAIAYSKLALTGAVLNADLAGSIADSKLDTIATGNKVSGSALQLASGSGLEDDSGIKISAGGVTNAMLAGSIADSKLSTIATADKVSGSAVQLAAASALENSTGLRLKAGAAGTGLSLDNNNALNVGALTNAEIAANAGIAYSKLTLTGAIVNGDITDSTIANAKLANSSVSLGGVSVALGASDATPAFDLTDATNYPTSSLTGTITNAQLAGSIANAKLANSAVTVTAGVGIAGGGSVSLGGTVSVTADVDDVSIGIDGGNKIGIKAAGVTLDNLAFQPRTDKFTGNGNTSAYNLTTRVLNASWRKMMVVSRNGQMLEYVASNPSDTSQFTTSDDSNNTTITFGDNISANDVITVLYFA